MQRFKLVLTRENSKIEQVYTREELQGIITYLIKMAKEGWDLTYFEPIIAQKI